MKWYFAFLVLILCVLSFLLGYREGESKPTFQEPERDTIVVVDTFITPEPEPVIKYKYKYEQIPVPELMWDTVHDTIYAVMPRERAVYQDSLYRAVVSGIRPSLDTLTIYPRTTTITIREKQEPKRWHLGVTGGVGYTGKFEPFIGVGVTYSFWDW